MKKTFRKTLSANDVGSTGAHQAGILVPKTDVELMTFLPHLDQGIKNPDAWIKCLDEGGNIRKFRYIYYNNKLHDPKGTRNEYRITHMTNYLKEMGAREGDFLEISISQGEQFYNIQVLRQETIIAKNEDEEGFRIKITSSWRRVH